MDKQRLFAALKSISTKTRSQTNLKLQCRSPVWFYTCSEQDFVNNTIMITIITFHLSVYGYGNTQNVHRPYSCL